MGNAGATTEYFGDSIASVGDVNGDGYDDLLVGAPRNPTAGTDNGGAYLFYGSNQGLMLWNGGATGMLIAPPTTSLDAGGNSSNTLQTQRYSGGLVAAAGDVNGDGYRDILIASRYDKTFGTSPSAWGGAFLYYGCGNGLNGSAVTCSNGSGIWGVPSVGGLTDSPVRNIDSCDPSNNHCQPLLFIPKGHTSLSGSTSFYNWGDSVGTVGDLNRSGHSEIAMGAAIVDSLCTSPSCPRSVIRTGGAVVFSGSPKGLSVTANVSRNPICVDKVCTPFYLTPSTSSWGDSSGNGQPAYFNLSIQGPWVDVKHQDFNGDGYPDFIIPFLSYISRDQKTAGMGGFYVFQ